MKVFIEANKIINSTSLQKYTCNLDIFPILSPLFLYTIQYHIYPRRHNLPFIKIYSIEHIETRPLSDVILPYFFPSRISQHQFVSNTSRSASLNDKLTSIKSIFPNHLYFNFNSYLPFYHIFSDKSIFDKSLDEIHSLHLSATQSPWELFLLPNLTPNIFILHDYFPIPTHILTPLHYYFYKFIENNGNSHTCSKHHTQLVLWNIIR